MKVLPFKIAKTNNLGLIYQEDRGAYFYDKLHQHDEIQICYVVKGEGTLLVGDLVNEYASGDILVIGGNQPHVFKSDTSNIAESFMKSLFFTKESFGDMFFELDDFKEITPFFGHAEVSFKVLTNKTELQSYFSQLSESGDFERFLIFLKMLQLITLSDIQKLSTFLLGKRLSDTEGKRMGKIIDYTLENFDKIVSLGEVSGIANMTPNAFCRYFKQRTNKTYFVFLNEIKIERACRLLKNKELLIADVSEQCGFKNLSNFNRKFKEIKGITPSEYKFHVL